MAALLTGCSSGPDVIAVQNNGVYYDGSVVQECRAGTYVGAFNTVNHGDAGPNFSFSGRMAFGLVQSRAGEFLELEQNAHLTGESNNPLPNATISATLIGRGPCNAGGISTEFQNGVYTAPSITVQFTGGAYGLYDPVQDAFTGFWVANLEVPSQTQLSGTWFAVRQP